MTFRYQVVGAASADLPLRVINLFAQQDLAIDAAQVVRAHDRYEVRVEIAGISAERATIILEKMRAYVLVERAEMVVLTDERLVADA